MAAHVLTTDTHLSVHRGHASAAARCRTTSHHHLAAASRHLVAVPSRNPGHRSTVPTRAHHRTAHWRYWASHAWSHRHAGSRAWWHLTVGCKRRAARHLSARHLGLHRSLNKHQPADERESTATSFAIVDAAMDHYSRTQLCRGAHNLIK